MMMHLSDPFEDLPTPGEWWREATSEQRISATQVIAVKLGLEVVETQTNGSVIVRLTSDLPASERGPLLLHLESELKSRVDGCIEIWLEPLGDRNRLRQLRGITVQSVRSIPAE